MPKLPPDVKISMHIIDRYSFLQYGNVSSGNSLELEREIRKLKGKGEKVDEHSLEFKTNFFVMELVNGRLYSIRKIVDYYR